ncbi:hypothetical protein EON67_09485, partial [archaeon]
MRVLLTSPPGCPLAGILSRPTCQTPCVSAPTFSRARPCPRPTLQGGAQLFWQWMNQSYNAAFNYGNRNATVPVDYRQLALSYGIATGTALSAAWGLGKVVQRVQASLGTAKPTFGFKLLQSGIPWLAVATAGTANALA